MGPELGSLRQFGGLERGFWGQTDLGFNSDFIINHMCDHGQIIEALLASVSSFVNGDNFPF